VLITQKSASDLNLIDKDDLEALPWCNVAQARKNAPSPHGAEVSERERSV
jgi:hypothetical protein